MNAGSTIFSQIISHLPQREFRRIVEKYNGNKNVRTFSCWDQFLCMSFAQLTQRSSLRDTIACLHSIPDKLYALGFRGNILKSNLADANNSRDWKIFAEFAIVVINKARTLYVDQNLIEELDATIYALDSTTIDLCLALFPWAHFRKTKAGVKLHTLYDLQCNIPSFIVITSAKVHDVNILDELIFEPGAFYIMDRGYLDFKRLYKISTSAAYFVTRSKRNTAFKRLKSLPVDKSTGIIAEQIVRFANKKDYPDRLRRIKYYEQELGRTFVFITNNFSLSALTIAKLYKSRWQIELFFKWIKQHLKIKSFFGVMENAVKTQIWIAVTTYVLVAIVKAELKIKIPLYNLLQVASFACLEKTPIFQALAEYKYTKQPLTCDNQLKLF